MANHCLVWKCSEGWYHAGILSGLALTEAAAGKHQFFLVLVSMKTCSRMAWLYRYSDHGLEQHHHHLWQVEFLQLPQEVLPLPAFLVRVLMVR